MATTIKGSSTDVTIKEGVTGSTLADVQSEKLGVTIEKVSETSQISATVGEKTGHGRRRQQYGQCCRRP